MLISIAPPPLHLYGLRDAGYLCQPSQTGMGFDPTMLLTSVLSPISQYFVAKEQSKTAKKAIALEASKLKTEKDQDARDYALARAQSQADALTNPAEEKRKEQMIVLFAVGGAALVISGLFIMGAVKNKRG